ncbi:Squalene synthetase [Wickerhamomyces ciferrii]|uniref:Squalene synthase n=1 Tax=Wickerhamomyces ciferrii (strain ATCC 14091 / BCRC 22168 / CBS 111 / JCM 3599 / NBRC 0793 / NRRL Y-1031 F-60-10) TaxID=1206466 RepID=K0KPZ7_WICCF|nr:Squalene synthetase [Wickerhamomyces ciferrii]CCH45106.1 Squalene synthetase [Wickerhamomyces ciferrii]
MGKVAQFALHPLEFRAALQLKNLHPRDQLNEGPSLKRCWELLKITSRSFAAVIEELHPELRNVIMLFYLVLRALDTVEDDMTIDQAIKVPLLRSFHEKLLTKDFTFNGNAPTEKDRCVLVEFDQILIEYHKLKEEYQDVIKDITLQMGNGMADYIENEEFNAKGLLTKKDYDLYCYYVAGLVGDGLTRLIVLAKFGDSKLYKDRQHLIGMGLFLQKTNIIRDYEEDQRDGRSFWPKEIWGNYTNDLSSFLDPKNEQQGLYCISELVVNALEHVIDVLQYLSLIEDQSSFNFCSIPQVMAIATLELVYQNPEVFKRNIKIRKGTTCWLILNSRKFDDVVRIFRSYIRKIHHKSTPNDPNYLKIGQLCGKIEQFIESIYPHDIPEGVTLKGNEVYDQVLKRSKFDAKIEPVISKENFEVNLVLGVVGLSVVFLLSKLVL